VSLSDHVAVVAPGLSLARREALVAAARSRDESTGVDAELERARERLASLGEPVPSLSAARRRVADAAADLEAKRERVATLRGRLQETDDETVADAYREAIRELSEAETDRAAAREALANARSRARRARDEREERLRLEDRVGNLERRERRELVEAVRPAVDSAVEDAPGAEASTFEEADAVTAALAVVRVGRVRTPVVLACRRFGSAADAETWLGAPVVRL
jgi:chromosome segregation ATPase